MFKIKGVTVFMLFNTKILNLKKKKKKNKERKKEIFAFSTVCTTKNCWPSSLHKQKT